MNNSDQKSQLLYLHEVYPSIQGESTCIGLPTVFVRTSACNLRCVWCDTPYAFGRGEPREIESVVNEVKSYRLPNVCVTGGEPLLQESILPFMRQLCDLGYHVSIETGGSLPISSIDSRVTVILDIKCPGSQMAHKNYWDNIPHLKQSDEIKFVLLDENDYRWAQNICNQYDLFTTGCEILFSPVHGEFNPQTLVEWVVRDHLPVRVNLQLHKYIWTPETQGV